MLRTPNQLVHYRFQEGSGSVLDASGNGRVATNNGATSAAGIFGKCYDFDGTNDTILSDSAINLGTGDFTLCCWIKPTAIDVEKYIASMGYNANSSLLLAQYNSPATYVNCILLAIVKPTTSNTISANNIITTDWQHILVTRSGTTTNIYHNSINVATLNGIYNDASINNKIELGWATTRAKAGTYFDGLIGEVMLYDSVLSTNDMKRVMMGMHPLLH